MKKAEKKKGKKAEYITRIGMSVLTAILIALFLWIMVLAGRIRVRHAWPIMRDWCAAGRSG